MEDMHKSSIIMVLLAVVFVMAIGYAAFSQQLTINGTASIDSSWDVHIEDIAVNGTTLDGKNVSATVGEDKLSASFQAELVSPGSSVTYDVTVKNGGTLDAKLDSIVFTDSNNDAIQYSYSGISQNDVIDAGRTQTFTITVKFNDAYTTMPESTTSSVTMNLTYVQG